MTLDRYLENMGWAFGQPECASVRLTMRQARGSVKVAAKGEYLTARYYNTADEIYSIVGWDSDGPWAIKRGGEPLDLRPDLYDEFYATMRLILNDLAGLPEENFDRVDFAPFGIGGTTVNVTPGAKIDALMWADGCLAAALLRLRGRAVRMVPLSAVKMRHGVFYTRWQRDNEPPIEVCDIRMGATVFDAEVRRPAMARRGPADDERSGEQVRAVRKFSAASPPIGAKPEQARESLRRLFESPELYPLRIHTDRNSIEFARMTREAYERSTFLDNRLYRADDSSLFFNVDQVRERKLLSTPLRTVNLHYVFLPAFGGSTLLSRYFEASRSLFVLKEPWVVTGLEAMRHEPTFVSDPDRWRQLFDIALALLTRPFDDTHGVVLKLCDNCLGIGRELLAWDSSATATFLYSDLTSYCAQVLKHNPRRLWIRGRAKSLAVYGKRYRELSDILISELDDASATAYVWTIYMLLFREISDANEGRRLRAYSSEDFYSDPEVLLRECLKSVLPDGEHDQEVQAMLSGRISQVHSKAGQSFSNDDRLKELSRHKEGLRPEIDKAFAWIASKYPDLMDLANGQKKL